MLILFDLDPVWSISWNKDNDVFSERQGI